MTYFYDMLKKNNEHNLSLICPMFQFNMYYEAHVGLTGYEAHAAQCASFRS